MSLQQQQCDACRADAPQVSADEIAELVAQVPGWEVVMEEQMLRLIRRYEFTDFAEALAFTNRVGAMAEEQGHHPALLTEWGQVTVRWWTHKIGGLHRNDFICAAKTDDLV